MTIIEYQKSIDKILWGYSSDEEDEEDEEEKGEKSNTRN
jgi:hypothetical protein